MTVLIVFNRQPYDGTDVTWNGLRLCGALGKTGQEVRIFLMNDAVDMARDANKPPEGYDQDLSGMLRGLIAARRSSAASDAARASGARRTGRERLGAHLRP